MELRDRIGRYVERRFQASGCTEFPTVRRVARAMRVPQKSVWEAVEGNPYAEVDGKDLTLMVTGVNIQRLPLGDHWVETV